MTDPTEKKEANIEKWGSWLYNVRDCFKVKSQEEIIASLNSTKLECSVLMQHIEHDFNMATVIRNSNNFNVKEVFYYGPRKKWDKRAATGTYKYISLKHLSEIESVIELKKNYSFVVIDNNIELSVPMKSFEYPKNSLFIFGEENSGVTKELMDLADYRVEIPSLGSVRSINVGCASAIVLNDYYQKL